MSNPFLLDIDDYKRDIDPIGQYKKQPAYYLSTSKSIPLEKAQQVVEAMFKTKAFPNMRNPIVTYLNRKENGDREKLTTTLSSYIYTTLNERRLMAPTMTTYDHPDVNLAFHVEYIDTNVSDRNKAKKAMFAAKAVKDYYVADYKNKEQLFVRSPSISFYTSQ